MTDLIKRYKRERRRIQTAIRKLKTAGYEVSKKIPKIPKKITEGSIRKLQKITTRSIQELATTVDLETGEIITARQAKVRAARARGEKRRKAAAAPMTESLPQVKVPAAPTPTPEQENEGLPYRVDVLIEIIKQKIETIKDANLPWFSSQVYKAMVEGFNAFLDIVDDEHRNTQEMLDQLEDISSSQIFNYSQYMSEQVTEAKVRSDEMREFGRMVNSQAINDIADNMDQIEDADEFEMAEDVPIEFRS